MTRTVKFPIGKSSVELAVIIDNVLAVVASLPQPRTQAHIVKACWDWASERTVLVALKKLQDADRIRSKRNSGSEYGLRREVKLYSVVAGTVVPELHPIAAFREIRRELVESSPDRIYQHCLRLIAGRAYPSRERVMRDLRLPDSVVRPVLEQLIDDGVIDPEELVETCPMVGLGELDANIVEERTAMVLAEKLGLKELPPDWREWRKRLRSKHVEIEWRPGWMLIHDGEPG